MDGVIYDFEEEIREVNDLKQYIVHYKAQIPDAPLLLFVGDSGCDTAFAHSQGKILKRRFNAVFFDRRGTGKTVTDYGETKGKEKEKLQEAEKELYGELCYQDLAELIDYLLERYEASSLYLLGNGFASALTLRYLSEHPQNVAYYIGAAQCTCTDVYEKARCMAMEYVFNSKGNVKQILFMGELNETTGGTYHTELMSKKQLAKLKIWQKGMGMFGFGDDSRMQNIGKESPLYSYKEEKLIKKRIDQAAKLALSKEIEGFDAAKLNISPETRGIFISGRKDFVHPYTLVREYWNTHFEHKAGGRKTMLELELVPDQNTRFVYEDPITFWALVFHHLEF